METSPNEQTPAPAVSPERAALAEQLRTPPTNPAEASEQMTALMRRLLSDTGRLDHQVRYLSTHVNDCNSILTHDLQYLLGCIQVLFEHAHLELPVRQPPLLDAKVELLTEAEKPDGEILDLRAAYRSKPHPVFGHYELLLSDKAFDLNKLQAKVATRLIEAFAKLKADETLVEDEFYFVRLHTIHPTPISADAVAVDPTTYAPTETPEAPTHDDAS